MSDEIEREGENECGWGVFLDPVPFYIFFPFSPAPAELSCYDIFSFSSGCSANKKQEGFGYAQEASDRFSFNYRESEREREIA